MDIGGQPCDAFEWVAPSYRLPQSHVVIARLDRAAVVADASHEEFQSSIIVGPSLNFSERRRFDQPTLLDAPVRVENIDDRPDVTRYRQMVGRFVLKTQVRLTDIVKGGIH